MKLNEMREKTVEELQNAIVDWKKDLFSYKLQLAGKTENSLVWYSSGLPAGLTLSPSGLISGTPLYSGKYYYVHIYAYDIYGHQAYKYFTLNVAANASAITTTTLPNATQGIVKALENSC